MEPAKIRLYNPPGFGYTNGMTFLKQFWSWLRGLFAGPHPPGPPPPPPEPPGLLPDPVTRKVLLIIFNPRVASQGNRRLNEVLGWNEVDPLVAGYVHDIHTSSHGYLNYEVVEEIVVDGFPVKADGFAYTAEGYLQAWQTRSGFHQPDLVDYARLLADYDIAARVNAGAIDEAWLFGMPYGGFYESIMGGPGAFFCNAPPLTGSGTSRRFIIMGFNYQRGVGEMLEAFGHRAEFILERVFQYRPGDANLWKRFIRYDKTHPGQAECGNVHFAPNSIADYDWGNPTPVSSYCRNWMKFPDLSGPPVTVDCSEWGNGDIRKHHTWWLSLFPHITGQSDGIAWNWWRYITDADTVG